MGLTGLVVGLVGVGIGIGIGIGFGIGIGMSDSGGAGGSRGRDSRDLIASGGEDREAPEGAFEEVAGMFLVGGPLAQHYRFVEEEARREKAEALARHDDVDASSSAGAAAAAAAGGSGAAGGGGEAGAFVPEAFEAADSIARRLEESGEREMLKLKLAARLQECGWVADMRERVRMLMLEPGGGELSVDEVQQRLSPVGRSAIPAVVKAELYDDIQRFVRATQEVGGGGP